MKKRIIISTRWDKLEFIGPRKNYKNLQAIEQNTYIGYDNDLKKFVVEKSDAEIILIQDSATLEALSTMHLHFSSDTDFLLFHQDSAITETERNSTFKNTKNGNHIYSDNFHYKPVFEFILDGEGNKLNRILEKLGFNEDQLNEKENLEAQLNLLHDIYGAKKAVDEIKKTDTYKLLEKVQSVDDFFGSLGESQKYDDKTHHLALIALRDSFFGA